MTTPEEDSGGIPPQFPRLDWSGIEMSMRRMNERLSLLADMMAGLPPFVEAQRGGIVFEYSKPDPRMGEEIAVDRLVPGDRVFILEGVFTVYRIDMKAPIPTVWLQELPDSPLYFEHTDYIPLANETEDQP